MPIQMIFKRISLAVILLAVLLCCTRQNYTKHTRCLDIISLVESDIACVLLSDDSKVTSFLCDKKRDTISLYKERFGEYEFTDEELYSNFSLSVYNLTDTTSFLKSSANEDEIVVLYNHFDLYDVDYGVSRPNIFYDAYTLTIDSTLLPIFKKDYSMLEQFSEYYK